MARKKSNFGQQSPTTDRARNANIEPLMPVEDLTAVAQEDSQPQATIQSETPSDARSTSKTPGGLNRRQKSKGGLQGMLQRNREREAYEAQNKNTKSSNLSSFLQGL